MTWLRISLRACRTSSKGTAAVSASPAEPIRAIAKFFFKDGAKFFVKGITYGPFKPDTYRY